MKDLGAKLFLPSLQKAAVFVGGVEKSPFGGERKTASWRGSLAIVSSFRNRGMAIRLFSSLHEHFEPTRNCHEKFVVIVKNAFRLV